MTSRPSYCRFCANACPILVEVENGLAIRVTGDPSNDIYHGYTCVKGRALPEQHNHPDRLLHSQKRMTDGTYRPISSQQLLDEVAAHLGELIDDHGSASIASYFGTMAANVSPITMPMTNAFMHGIGSPLQFNPDTIDQAGKQVAKGLHGVWMAPIQGFDNPDVGLIVGANPLVSYAGGLPMGHPGKWLQRWVRRGFRLIVIDPRRSDLAKRATIHLQPRPGHDSAILAGILRVILSEGLQDRAFADENVTGMDRLAEAIEPFTPAHVASRADIDPEDLVAAARIFAAAERGFACAGTGPNMSGPGTVVEYLLLNLNTVCGRWLRAGEAVRAPSTVMPPMPAKAQAVGPTGFRPSDPLPGTGMRGSAVGLPVAGLPGAILHDGDDRVRALVSIGGNPAAAWPDQLTAVEALQNLDLLVQVDITMSATAQLAHYVVAPKMSLETASFTLIQDALAYYGAAYMGHAEPWAQYSEAVIEPPEGSDLLEDWQFLYGLAQRLGLQLEFGPHLPWAVTPATTLDMTTPPSSEDLLQLLAAGSRVPLDEVKRHPHGAVFPEPPLVVQARDPDSTDRLDVANPLMMSDLERIAGEAVAEPSSTLPSVDPLEFRLISRRLQQVCNSSGRSLKGMRARPYNPAFLHPADLEHLGLQSGDLAEIRSARAAIVAVVEPDDTLRRGLVSMTHAFGGLPDRETDVRQTGANTGRLLSVDRDLQPYTSQPRMSNVPVAVKAIDKTRRPT